MKRVFLLLIRFYQLAISPYFPPRCRFTPTCSQYALEAVEKYGAVKGGFLASAAMPSLSQGKLLRPGPIRKRAV